MRPLSRGARGSAVPLIIDVAGNLRRQETELPAVPPHHDIIPGRMADSGSGVPSPEPPRSPSGRLAHKPANERTTSGAAPSARTCTALRFPRERDGREGKGRNVLVFGPLESR